jgi:hypothetical protein
MKDFFEHFQSFACVVLFYVIGMALLSLPRFYFGMEMTEYLITILLTALLITSFYVLFIADHCIRKLFSNK